MNSRTTQARLVETAKLLSHPPSLQAGSVSRVFFAELVIRDRGDKQCVQNLGRRIKDFGRIQGAPSCIILLPLLCVIQPHQRGSVDHNNGNRQSQSANKSAGFQWGKTTVVETVAEAVRIPGSPSLSADSTAHPFNVHTGTPGRHALVRHALHSANHLPGCGPAARWEQRS